MLEEPQVASTGIVQPLPVDDGDHRVLGLPFTLNGARTSEHQPPPRLGAHTQQLLLEAGLSADAIEALHKRGVVG
jgi:crotonobetainyl-CoA:carnitine CoA-transferase CaiB-like acyl-CoA transferase